MTEPNQAGASLPPDKVATLLASALRARKNGNLPAARALLRVLAAEQPGMPQIWMALATVAETRAEQRHALERVAALDPTNPLAQRGLARMGAAQPAQTEAAPAAQPQPLAAEPPPAGVSGATSQAAPSRMRAETAADQPAEPGVGPAPALTPIVVSEQAAARAIRWPLYLVVAISIVVVLVALLLIRGADLGSQAAAPTSALPGAATPPAASSQAPASIAEPSRPAEAAAPAPSPPPSATPRPTAAPTATPRPTLEIGAVIKRGIWHAVLLRPNDAVLLEGSVGDFQPRGRFVLALVAVGNDGSAPAPLPADFFALIDRAGNRYAPLPAVSTAYLNVYGRGQRGDLSLEDAIPADGGNKSVPLIFDVPASAGELYLVVTGDAAGWPIRQ